MDAEDGMDAAGALGAWDFARERVRAGADGGTTAGRLGAALDVGVGIAPATRIPPWRAHAPRPGLLDAPSVHVTIVPVDFACCIAAFCSAFIVFSAAFIAFRSTPPCPEQAPRPLVAELEPSLHAVAGACAASGAARSENTRSESVAGRIAEPLGSGMNPRVSVRPHQHAQAGP
jgi:hypothetical protein